MLKTQKVTLLACPWIFQHPDPEFQSQQLGLTCIGSYIEKCGHKIAGYVDPMLDGGHCKLEKIITKYQTVYRVGHSDDWILEEINNDAEWIFINAPFTDSRFAFYPLCNKIKERFPYKKIVVGGILATSLPFQVMEETPSDIVVRGEGEIISSMILNDEDLSLIPNILYRSNGRIVENLESATQVKLDELPWIGKSNFRPFHKYLCWSPRGNKLDKTFSCITSRGCPFTCSFCSVPNKGQTWRHFSSERVVSEIKHMINKFDINHLEIEDDNFTFNSTRTIEILDAIKEIRKTGKNIVPTFPNGIMLQRLDKDQIIALKESGTEEIYLPIESGDVKNLIAMNKPNADRHLEKGLQVASWCKEAGLIANTFIIVGYPGGRVLDNKYRKIIESEYRDDIILREDNSIWIRGEDEKSFEKTISYLHELIGAGISAISPLIATPYPNTALYFACEKFGWLRYPDCKDMITTISYKNMKEEFININTPWCGYARIFERWKKISTLFPVKHNIIKEKNNDKVL